MRRKGKEREKKTGGEGQEEGGGNENIMCGPQLSGGCGSNVE